MANKTFAKTNPLFLKSCELAKVQPTVRQASKFRMGKGTAFEWAADARHAKEAADDTPQE